MFDKPYAVSFQIKVIVMAQTGDVAMQKAENLLDLPIMETVGVVSKCVKLLKEE